MSKRIVLCCDGTWNTPDQMADGKRCQTNVAKLAAAVAEADPQGMPQLVFYQPGVGTAPGERLRGGALGMGLSRGVQEVYRFLVANFDPGDEIFLFGFSRGAYMARSTAGLIRNAGVLRRENIDRIDQAYALYRDRATHPRDAQSRLFRRSFSHDGVPIRCIGVWDTVGALGIPWSGVPAIDRLNRRWAFHDTQLSTKVQAAFQALAIDEVRKPFQPAVWEQQPDAVDQTLEQVWFAGVHCDVGGGYPATGLSDIALGWMVDRASSCGLAFTEGAFQPSTSGGGVGEPMPFVPDPLGALHDSRKGLYKLVSPYRRTIGSKPSGREFLAATSVTRKDQDSTYAPENLLAALAVPHPVMDL